MTDKAKKYGTEEERIALAERLDKELDEFIANLERKTYKDGVKPEDWDKELQSHPFFMHSAPENGETSPLLEGLTQLKYSPEENSPEELGIAYKEDGNVQFKAGKYRIAIVAYSEGLKLNFDNTHLRTQLYHNRGTSHYKLQNYRSAYNDLKSALKIDPEYVKSLTMLAQASKALGNYDECISLCDTLLKHENPMAFRIKKEAIEAKQKKERDQRKAEAMKRKEKLELDKLKEMLELRGIKFHGQPFWEKTETELPHKICIEDDHLIWPVVLLYPEFKTSDLIEDFHEDDTFEEQLHEVFSEFPEWDTERKYTLDSIIIHYEDTNGKIHVVKKNSTLRSVVSEADFRIDGSSPAFIVHANGSPAFEAFMKNYN